MNADEKVKDIRAMKKAGISTLFIAKKYDVDWHTICSVLNGKAWS